MIKLFENQKESIYKIQQNLNLDKMRLYRYADGSLNVRNMPAELILKLANYFKIEPNKLYEEMIEYEAKNKRRCNSRIN